jgi:pimeloyl-ACP methyl ester carboxylesterase
VPLPWFIKQRFLETFLRDAHHYLFDVEFTPRPGTTYRVQQEIRRRMIEALNAPEVTSPHVVVSHSMGTIIAYDCLKRVGDCPRIHALMTLGSPLGIDEIQDKLRPEWRRHDGFPSTTVETEWVNIADPLDVVCGPDPKIGNDFRRNGEAVVADLLVSNPGLWRHNIVEYFHRETTAQKLRQLLGL